MSTRVSSESEYSAGSARCQSKRFHNLIGLGPRKLVTGKHVTQACGDVNKRLGFSGSFLILAADWSHVHDRPAEICKAHRAQFPAMLKHVEACDYEGDRRKGQRKEGEHCEQFLNEVKLGHHDDGQEPPQPFAIVVLELGLHASLLMGAAPATCREFLLR